MSPFGQSPPHPPGGRPLVSAEVRLRWDGAPTASPRAWVGAELLPAGASGSAERTVRVSLEAAYCADPPPASAPGPCPGLWEHEVVELMLLGSRDRYLEIECGPHGHYLLLWLQGRRRVLQQGLPASYHCRIDGARWRARLDLPAAWLPPELERFNAYAIDGPPGGRRYWAHAAVAGPKPDFHRLECFVPVLG